MKISTEYRIARLYFLYDLMQSIAEKEPRLLDATDWNPNTDAIDQLITLIEKGEA